MHWVLCNLACLVCGELMLLFPCMAVESGLLTCFVALALGCGAEGLGSIVLVYDWGSCLVWGLYLVVVCQWLVSLDVEVCSYGVWIVCVWDIAEICWWWGWEEDFLQCVCFLFICSHFAF